MPVAKQCFIFSFFVGLVVLYVLTLVGFYMAVTTSGHRVALFEPRHVEVITSQKPTARNIQLSSHQTDESSFSFGKDTTAESSETRKEKGINMKLSAIDSAYRRRGFWNMSLMEKMEIPRPLFNFTLRPWSITCDERTISSSQGGPRWSMIVGVKSTSEHFQRRTRIRETWGSYKLFHGVQLQVIFVVTNAESVESEMKLAKENRENGDLLQIDKKEVYKEVGLKTLATMQWVSRHCPTYWLYSSADDDVVPNLLTLYMKIENMAPTRPGFSFNQGLKSLPIVCGYHYRTDGVVQRTTGKNIVSFELYSLKKYPVFCGGGFYTMPVALSNAIFLMSRYHEYFHADDVWITGLLRLAVVDAGEYACYDVTDDHCAILKENIKIAEHVHNDNLVSNYWNKVKQAMDEAQP